MGKYLDEKSIEKNRRERKAAMEEKRRMEDSRRAWAWVGLVMTDTALLAMLLLDLIDPVIGTVVLAAVSAVFGRGTK